jgi:hypothetical protein
MSDEQPRTDIRRLWQSQKEEITSMSLHDLRSGAAKMNRILLARAIGGGLGLLIFMGFFSVLLSSKPSPPLVTATDIQILRCVFLVGAGFGFWQLLAALRRARGKSLLDGEPSACAAFYRSELERQRDSARRAAVWAPLGFSAVWISCGLLVPTFRTVMIVIWVLFVPFWIYHSIESARRFQRELDELNAISARGDPSGPQAARASRKAPRD